MLIFYSVILHVEHLTTFLDKKNKLFVWHMCFVFLPSAIQLGDSPFRIFSSDIEFVKCLDVSLWIWWNLCLKIFSFIHLLNDCKKQTIVINVFSKTLNIMWCNLKALWMMCHLRNSREKCPYDPFFCLSGQNSLYTSLTPKSVFPLVVIFMLTEPPTS